MRQVLQSFACLAVLGFVLVGCGPPGGYVKYPESGATLEGTVTYGSDKLAAALIIAQGADLAVTGFLDDSGHYKLENVPVGDVNIGVNTVAGKGQMMGRKTAKARTKEGDVPKVLDLPAKYQDPMKSGIKTTVNKGANTFDIVIHKGS